MACLRLGNAPAGQRAGRLVQLVLEDSVGEALVGNVEDKEVRPHKKEGGRHTAEDGEHIWPRVGSQRAAGERAKQPEQCRGAREGHNVGAREEIERTEEAAEQREELSLVDLSALQSPRKCWSLTSSTAPLRERKTTVEPSADGWISLIAWVRTMMNSFGVVLACDGSDS